MEQITQAQQNEIFERDNFQCQKCNFKDYKGTELKIFPLNKNKKSLITLCAVCYSHAPDNEAQFRKYISQKIGSSLLDTFRASEHSISKKIRAGMERKAKEGNFVAKAPRGYALVNKELKIDVAESEEVNQIFKEFLETSISLTQLAKNNGMTTSGIKKLLMNTTYLGKIKFAGMEVRGNHTPIISQELFNNVKIKLGGNEKT